MVEEAETDNIQDEDTRLSSQLDELITQIKQQHDPDEPAPAPEAADARPPTDEATQPQVEQPAAPEAKTSGDGASEELTDQIDQMLSETANADKDAAPTDAQQQPTQAQSAHDEADPSAVPDGAAESPDSPVKISTEPDQDDNHGVMSAEAIDEILADLADGAVDGAFETVKDVLEAEKTSAASDDQASSPVDQPANAAPPGKDNEELKGAFEAPEDVIENRADSPSPNETAESPTPSGFQADADAVDQELDEQPEEGVAVDTAPPDKDEPAPTRRMPRIVINAKWLKSTCWALNLPLSRLSPSVRNLIGYVGLVTLFNGAVLFGYAMIKRIMGVE